MARILPRMTKHKVTVDATPEQWKEIIRDGDFLSDILTAVFHSKFMTYEVRVTCEKLLFVTCIPEDTELKTICQIEQEIQSIVKMAISNHNEIVESRQKEY